MDSIENLHERLDRLEASIREQTVKNAEQQNQIETLLKRHHRQFEASISAQVVFGAAVLLLLFGLRVETSNVTFGFPVELLFVPGGVLTVLAAHFLENKRKNGGSSS